MRMFLLCIQGALRFGRNFAALSMLSASALAATATNVFEITPSQFAARAEAKQAIRFEAVDTNLMSAAVLHETNRRRAENKLRPLRHHPKALQAAAIQSQIMQKRGSISHENPENAKYQTLIKRVQA